MSDKIFVGLGNPGQKYEHTRHNFGFEVLDKIANSVNLNFKDTGREKVCVFNFNSQSKIYLFKPLTFMNDSGAPLSSFMHYYKISAENIFVFYDDFAIELGQYKIKMSGSSGGHNGIKSIIAHLNTQDFWRMKLGIG
ncbi:MAG: aminoacyl-tRNA hydrolase, partial [Elusimicrobiota bacterium]|nr:aminoacyl-tRNA hydrolase [Elusimicrobiota bacterium]